MDVIIDQLFMLQLFAVERIVTSIRKRSMSIFFHICVSARAYG